MDAHPHPSGPRPDPRGLLLRRTDLDPIAWQVLLHDGHLVPLRPDVALPAGVAADAPTRAAALGHHVPSGCVVGRETAAWVHLGGPAQEVVHVLAPAGARAPGPRPGRTAAESDVRDDEVVVLGGVAVTTPRRTALDLLVRSDPTTARDAVLALARAGLVDPDRLRADVAHAAGRRGIRGAVAVLADVLGSARVPVAA